ncbi:MAG: hypothetical protein J5649_06875 [Lachnospiraceae bacterium]|nr:hypothetical protein [Lachnospiraceae bacterium]
MKRNVIWILSLILLVGCLCAGILYSRKSSRKETGSETAPTGSSETFSEETKTSETVSQAGQSAQTQPQDSVPQAGQDAQTQPQDSEEKLQTIVAAEPSEDTDLPEIEIPDPPVGTGEQGNTEGDTLTASTGQESVGPDKTADDPDVATPTSKPADNEILQTEPVSQEDTGSGDVYVDENGDILLPEAP